MWHITLNLHCSQPSAEKKKKRRPKKKGEKKGLIKPFYLGRTGEDPKKGGKKKEDQRHHENRTPLSFRLLPKRAITLPRGLKKRESKEKKKEKGGGGGEKDRASFSKAQEPNHRIRKNRRPEKGQKKKRE